MWHPVILVQLQPKRAGWFQLVACTHWFLHLAATVEALCATAHFLRVFSGSLMNPPNRQKLWDDFNRSCILLPRLLPKSCRHNERFLSALVRLLFQAYLVLYRPKQGGRQGTAWRSSTLQDVRQNPSPALKESPRMGTEFGCKICMLCADCRPHCGAEKKLEVEKKTCRGRKQDGPIAGSSKRHFGVEKKSSP